MFTPSSKRIFKRRVIVMTPSESSETAHTQGEFTAEFKQLSEDRIEELQSESNVKFLDEVLIGAHGIGDSDKNLLDPQDEETLKLVKNDTCAATATVTAYIKATTGKNTARKN